MAVKKAKKSCVYVIRDGRYIRKEADKDSASICKVAKGDKFEYLGEVVNGWFKVKVNRKTGWIHNTTGSIREM